MSRGQITSGEKGLFLWEIRDFTISWENNFTVCSPLFQFSGVEYKIELRKSKDSYNIETILYQQNKGPHPHVPFEFKLRSGKESVAPSYVVIPNGRSSYVSCGMDVEEYIENRKGSVLFPCLIVSLQMGGEWTYPGFTTTTPTRTTLKFNPPTGTDTVMKGGLCTYNIGVRYQCITHIKEYENKSFEELRLEDYAYAANGKRGAAEGITFAIAKLQTDFKKLVLSKEDSDVTLKVQGTKFPAHKAILRARSSIFDAMFNHDMAEKQSGDVNIEDCDPKSFPAFLHYLYTGSMEKVGDENICQLFSASDKYEVLELKAHCVEFMKSHLSVDTFCDFLALALRHQEGDLIRAATEFFCDNASEIVPSTKWQVFLEKNVTAGNELFIRLVTRGKTA